MPKLPSAINLGAMPRVEGSRPVGGYDTGGYREAAAAYGRGGAALAASEEALGKGIAKAGEGLAELEQSKSRYEYHEAAAEQTTRLIELREALKTDTDYASMDKRYAEASAKINADVAQKISSPFMRERFSTDAAPKMAQFNADVASHARSLEAGAKNAWRATVRDKIINDLVTNPNEAARANDIDQYNGLVDAARGRGYINDIEAQREKKEFAVRYVKAGILAVADKDPAEAVRRLENPDSKSIAAIIPADERLALLEHAKIAVERKANKDSAMRSEDFERVIIDSAAGIGQLPDRKVIENDPILKPDRKNAVLRQYDHAVGDVAALHAVAAKFANPDAGPFKPFDKTERDAVDKLYKVLGGDGPALQRIVDRTGMVPTSVATALRGDLVSTNPQRVASALQATSNMIAQNPAVFAAAPGKKEFEDAAIEFTHNTQDLGMTAEQAAAKYIESRTPEYEAKVKAKIKGEDLNEIVKKNLSVDDARAAFDTSWWPGKPAMAFAPAERQAMYADYEQAFREAYLDNGDIGKSKAIAADKMKKTWGVTKVSGSEVVMRYPPERAPAYAGLEDISDKVAEQAIKAVKEETGATIERGQLRIDPVAGGRTSSAYWRGQPPPYLLSWQDKQGVVHYLNPGRAFVADPNDMRAAQTEKRRVEFEAAQKRSEAGRPRPPGQRRTGRLTPSNLAPAPSGGPDQPVLGAINTEE